MNRLWAFYRWYDGLADPWRFLTFLMLVEPGQVLYIYGNVPLSILGISYLGLLTLTRIFYVEWFFVERS